MKNPEKMSREELVEEVLSLQERVRLLLTSKNTDWVDQLEIGAGPKRLMRVLLRHEGKRVSHDTLLAGSTDQPWDVSPRMVTVYICYLRKALRGTNYHITNHWGEGYTLYRRDHG